MKYNFDNDRPIYIQIVELLEMMIISGKLKPSDKIPSVREYALDFKVNPNTMQRALTELEDKKLIYTQRTNGKYVTEDENVIKKFKTEFINKRLDSFVESMNNIGVSKKDIKKHLEERIKNEDN